MDIHLPTKIIFGCGRIREIRRHLPPGIERVLVVSDPGVDEHSRALGVLREQLTDLDVHVFLDVEPNPSLTTVEKGAALAREKGSQLIVGIGGGSPMDAGKGMAVLATNAGDLKSYMRGRALDAAPLPVVCVPTTAGTGSEVTPYAVFTDPDTQDKGGYSNPHIFPVVSIIDPELTYSMPESVATDTGLDSLTHAIEAYLSTASSPFSDLFALQAVKIIRDQLRSAIAKDLPAMAAVCYAAMLAGVAIAHASTILLHIMGYPLTVFRQVPHGRANAALLPAFMTFLESSIKTRRLEEEFAGIGGIGRFVQDLGVSTNLASYGVTEEDIDRFVAKCLGKSDLEITPAPIDAEAIRKIYAAGLHG